MDKMKIDQIATAVKELLPKIYAYETLVYYSEIAHALRVKIGHMLLIGIFPDDYRFTIYLYQHGVSSDMARELAEYLPQAAMVCDWLNNHINVIELNETL